MEIKKCTKCGEIKDISEFYKKKDSKDGFQSVCKECSKVNNKKNYQKYRKKRLSHQKEYYKEHKEERAEYMKKYWKECSEDMIEHKKKSGKKYYENNKDKILEKHRRYQEGNKNKISDQKRKYNHSRSVKYNIYAPQIEFCEEIRRNPDNFDFLQVRCAYCGKWFSPKLMYIKSRIQSLNEINLGERRLYCSKECKTLCPTYYKVKYSAEETNTKRYSREVQPELRQLVFERDNWTCIKCGSEESLQCHHIDGIWKEPLLSADIEECITLCKECHKKVHKKEGCKRSDLMCSDTYNEIG